MNGHSIPRSVHNARFFDGDNCDTQNSVPRGTVTGKWCTREIAFVSPSKSHVSRVSRVSGDRESARPKRRPASIIFLTLFSFLYTTVCGTTPSDSRIALVISTCLSVAFGHLTLIVRSMPTISYAVRDSDFGCLPSR